jgi:hypothetical protein
MAFNANKFLSEISKKNGITRRTHFELRVGIPFFLVDAGYPADHLTLTGVSTNIPSISLESTDIRRSTVSYKESFPTNVNFGDLAATFFSDGQGKTLTVFKEWMNYIYRSGVEVADPVYRVPYKRDYATTTSIIHFDAEGKSVVEYTFYEVFPYALNDVSLNWGAFDDVVTLSVDFKYSTYSVKSFNTSTQPKETAQIVQKSPAKNNRLLENSLIDRIQQKII